ncbi:SCO7613 C-terminal domain-containing membrane protein [Salinactinospora qingdaonensis]
MNASPPLPRCPECATPVPPSAGDCRTCGLPLAGREAARLLQVTDALYRLERDRANLLAEHAALLERLRAERAARRAAVSHARDRSATAAHEAQGAPARHAPAGSSAPVAAPAAPPAPPLADAPAAGRAPRPPREITARSVQNTLLALGGLLVAIAAVVFTVVTWDRIGIGGQSAILAGVTVATASCAVPLRRRGMGATAETAGALAAVLLALDAFALWRFIGSGLDPFGYAATAAALIAGLLGYYGWRVRLRGPRAVAVVLAQPVTVLAMAALGTDTTWVPTAVLLTTLGDVALARWLGRGRLRSLALGLAAVTGCLGTAWPVWLLARAGYVAMAAPGTAVPLASPAALAAATALVLAGAAAALALPGAARGRAAFWCAAMLAWGAVPVVLTAASPLPAGWTVTALATSGAAITVAAARLQGETRRGAEVAACCALAATTALALPLLIHATVGHLLWFGSPWQGTVITVAEGQPDAGVTAAVVLVAATVAGWGAWRRTRSDWLFDCAALAALVGLVGAVWLPGWGTVALVTAVAVGGIAVAVAADRDTPMGWGARRDSAALLAGAVSVLAVGAGLSGAAATIAVLSCLAAATVTAGVPATAPRLRAGCAAGAVTLVTALVGAGFLASSPPSAAMVLGVPTAGVPALAMLAVAALAVGTATILALGRRRGIQVGALDAAAVLPATVAVSVAAGSGSAPMAALPVAVSALLALVAATHTQAQWWQRDRFAAGKADSGGWGHSPGAADAPAAEGTLGAQRLTGPAGYRLPGGAARLRRWRLARTRMVLAASAGGTAVSALLVVAAAIAATAAGPLSTVMDPWRGDTGAEGLAMAGAPAGPVFLLSCAVALLVVAMAPAVGRGHRVGTTAPIVAAGAMAPLLVTHLPVAHDAGLAILVATSTLLWLRATAAGGWGAHAAVWTGAAVALLGAGWALTDPVRTIAVLSGVSGAAVLAATLFTAGTRQSAPGAVRSLTALAAFGVTVTVLTCSAALPYAGVSADPRRQPFLALALAGAVAAVARIDALRQRPHQRGGLIGGGLATVVLAPMLGAGSPASPGLVWAGAALVLLALTVSLRRRAATVLAGVGVATMAVALATVADRLLLVLVGPYTWLSAVWRGTGAAGMLTPADEVVTPGAAAVNGEASLPVVVAAVALGALLLVRGRRPRLLPHAAVLLATPVLAPYATTVGLTYGVALGWLLFVATALVGAGTLTTRPRLAALSGGAALWPASMAVAWGLAERPATLVTLGMVAVIAATGPALCSFMAETGRAGVERLPQPVAFVAGATAVATVATGAFALTLPLALGARADVAALAPIAVIAAVMATIGVVRLERSVVVAAEVSLGVLAAASIALTFAGGTRLELTSLALACLGAIALAGAARQGRWWFGVVGATLLLAALWLFLGWVGVAAPEPYTALPALAALAVGREWRRRRTGTSTWLAYGPGLGLLLVPGLVVGYAVPAEPWRVAALGAVALTVTLCGARWRLQAPLLIGGVVLVLATGKAVGPPLWEIVVALPNWIPVGAAGVALLLVGARYERRLRDLRRLGRVLSDMD